MVLSVAWAVGLAVIVPIAASSPEPERDEKGQIGKPAQAAPSKFG